MEDENTTSHAMIIVEKDSVKKDYLLSENQNSRYDYPLKTVIEDYSKNSKFKKGGIYIYKMK